MSDVPGYKSVKPLTVKRPKRDDQKAWHPPGAVTVSSYERKKFREAFRKPTA